MNILFPLQAIKIDISYVFIYGNWYRLLLLIIITGVIQGGPKEPDYFCGSVIFLITTIKTKKK